MFFFYIHITFLRLLKYCAQFKSKFRIQIQSITLAWYRRRHNIDDVMFRQRAVMGAREGRYGCTRGPIMGFESRAISARVTKQIVTIFSKTCDKCVS